MKINLKQNQEVKVSGDYTREEAIQLLKEVSEQTSPKIYDGKCNYFSMSSALDNQTLVTAIEDASIPLLLGVNENSEAVLLDLEDENITFLGILSSFISDDAMTKYQIDVISTIYQQLNLFSESASVLNVITATNTPDILLLDRERLILNNTNYFLLIPLLDKLIEDRIAYVSENGSINKLIVNIVATYSGLSEFYLSLYSSNLVLANITIVFTCYTTDNLPNKLSVISLNGVSPTVAYINPTNILQDVVRVAKTTATKDVERRNILFLDDRNAKVNDFYSVSELQPTIASNYDSFEVVKEFVKSYTHKSRLTLG